jgi:hypothetical protein
MYLLRVGPDRTGVDLDKAARLLPPSETQALIQSTSANNRGPRLVKDADLPRAMANNRISSAICNWCWKKGDTPLFYCQSCHCTWFCSTACKDADGGHRAWCCNPDATPDQGPLAVKLVDMYQQDKDVIPSDADTPTADMIRARQTASTTSVQLQLKEMGNAHFRESRFRDALTCYTAGIRVLGPMTDLRKALWMNRARTYASLALPMLAFVDVSLLEAGLGCRMESAKDLLTLANFQIHVGELAAARHTLTSRVVGVEGAPAARISAMIKILYKAEKEQQKRTAERTALPIRNMPASMTSASFVDKQTQGSTYQPCVLRLFSTDENQKSYLNSIDSKLKPYLTTRRGDEADGGISVESLVACKQGQLLATDPPLLTGSIDDTRCARCSKKFMSLAPGGIIMATPCKKSCGELYCSPACRDTSADTHHTWQCNKNIQRNLREMRQAVAKQGMTMSSRTPLCIARALGMVPSRRRNLLDELRPLQHLSLGKFNDGRVSVQQGLQQYTALLQELQLDPAWFDYYTYDYARFAIINNAFVLRSADPAAYQIGFGIALYGASTYFNHSCVPDVRWSMSRVDDSGASMQLTALRDIAAGEPVYISYIDHHQPLATRTEALMQYGFTCHCARCIAERE